MRQSQVSCLGRLIRKSLNETAIANALCSQLGKARCDRPYRLDIRSLVPVYATIRQRREVGGIMAEVHVDPCFLNLLHFATR